MIQWLENIKWVRDIYDRLVHQFYARHNFSDLLFAFLQTEFLLKWDLLRKKRIFFPRSKFCLLEWILESKCFSSNIFWQNCLSWKCIYSSYDKWICLMDFTNIWRRRHLLLCAANMAVETCSKMKSFIPQFWEQIRKKNVPCLVFKGRQTWEGCQILSHCQFD